MSSSFGKSISKISSSFIEFNKSSLLLSTRSKSIFSKTDKTNVNNASPFIIIRAQKEDHDEILKVMHQTYYTEEPTCKALEITQNPVLDEQAIRALTEGLSLVAKCRYDGSIVGAAINQSHSPWDPDLLEKLASNVRCPKVKQLLLFYAYMMRAPGIFECLEVQKVFEMSYLFVQKSHRKNGIAFSLLRDSKSLGADCGFGVIRCDATNTNTAKICERLNMDMVLEIPYCSYLGPNLEPVFKPPYPHTSVKIFCDCAPQLHEYQERLKKKAKDFQAQLKSFEKKTTV